MSLVAVLTPRLKQPLALLRSVSLLFGARIECRADISMSRKTKAKIQGNPVPLRNDPEWRHSDGRLDIKSA
jgi:hypothetical protein